ncbi:MAG TPA: hypothetical protein VM534_04235 [Thermoanaerobaculia bacterium]|nr:hypothetical protein [Thermoanaerobaculia bacterium]
MDDRKIWWQQSEYLIALTTAVDIDPGPEAVARLERHCEWLFRAQIDHQDGMWHARLSRTGQRIDSAKHGPWKAGYYEVRAMSLFAEGFGTSASSPRILSFDPVSGGSRVSG